MELNNEDFTSCVLKLQVQIYDTAMTYADKAMQIAEERARSNA